MELSSNFKVTWAESPITYSYVHTYKGWTEQDTIVVKGLEFVMLVHLPMPHGQDPGSGLSAALVRKGKGHQPEVGELGFHLHHLRRVNNGEHPSTYSASRSPSDRQAPYPGAPCAGCRVL